MERFAAWIEKCGRSRYAIAKELGISPGSLYDLLSGRRTPSIQLAFQIEDLTGGKVRCAHWRADVMKSA